MILTKTPLRISFVGGGSDRPTFYSEEPGACVAAAIDKYVYVAVNPKYDGSIRAAYSVTENVATVDELNHELIREALSIFSYKTEHGIEIHSIADIPAGTGLGSSSSFTVGMLLALDNPARQNEADTRWIAETACEIEIDRCGHPIGKQDQYAAAFGGLNLYRFTASGVTVTPIACDLAALSAHCLLLDTGARRDGDAGQVLAGQKQGRDDVRALASVAGDFAASLSAGDWRGCGALLDTAWQIKRRFIADARIDVFYTTARNAGAWGGKLCGAGGGGFLLLLAPPEKHQLIATATGLRRVPIEVGVAGSEVVWH